MKPNRMILILCVLLLSLTACAVQPEVSAETIPTEVSTETPIPPTATKVATATNSPVPTETAEPMPTITPSPMPTQSPYIMITPNAMQASKWKEYEAAIGEFFLTAEYHKGEKILCEWILLGEEPGKLFAWVKCSGTVSSPGGYYSGHEAPTAIVIDENDNVIEILTPNSVSTSYTEGVEMLFPANIQEIIFSRQIDYESFSNHLEYRREHPDEPPLIITENTSGSENN